MQMNVLTNDISLCPSSSYFIAVLLFIYLFICISKGLNSEREEVGKEEESALQPKKKREEGERKRERERERK